MKKFKSLLIGLFAFAAVCGLAPITAEAAVPTQQEALAWVRSMVGKGLDMDGAYGNQCVDLILAYYDFLGVPRSSGNATDYTWNTLPSGFQRIQGAQPQPGDILVYTNGYGHVAIYESDRVHYHQNFNSHPYVEVVTYRYNGLSNPYWGVIRPNFSSVPTPVTMTWTNEDCQPDASNVYVHTTANPGKSGLFTQAGLKVWDDTGKQVVDIVENTSISHSYMNVWYNVTNDSGVVLESGTQHTYQFWAVFNGEKFFGPVHSFKTAGTKPMPFVDVSRANWFYDSVNKVYTENLMTGTTATTFSPYQNLTRAQFAVILHRMNGAPQMNYQWTFPDVPNGKWYTDAVLWANSKGIITGYANKMFGPSDNLTREQMALMMYRYANMKGHDTSQRADFSGFTDAYDVSRFAQEALRWTVANGIINGKDDGTRLDPLGNANRAECATIMKRFLEKYE